MKSLDDIWEEYINTEVLTPETIKDLMWHLQNDQESETYTMIIDMLVREIGDLLSQTFVPYLAKNLDSDDPYERERAVKSLVGRLRLAKYAEKALDMAKNDTEPNVRALAAASLGAVLDNVDPILRKKMAIYIYDAVTEDMYSDLHKEDAYQSVLEAMRVPINKWPPIEWNTDAEEIIDKSLVKKFRKKYSVA